MHVYIYRERDRNYRSVTISRTTRTHTHTHQGHEYTIYIYLCVGILLKQFLMTHFGIAGLKVMPCCLVSYRVYPVIEAAWAPVSWSVRPTFNSNLGWEEQADSWRHHDLPWACHAASVLSGLFFLRTASILGIFLRFFFIWVFWKDPKENQGNMKLG